MIAIFPKQRTKNGRNALATYTLSQISQGDTMSIAVPEGEFLRELGRLCDEPQGMLMFGTSANLTGQGQRLWLRIEDIEPSVRDSVDLVIDYGLQKWHAYGRGGVNFDVENMKVLRMGAVYKVLRDRMIRWFPHLLKEAGVELDTDPVYNGMDMDSHHR